MKTLQNTGICGRSRYSPTLGELIESETEAIEVLMERGAIAQVIENCAFRRDVYRVLAARFGGAVKLKTIAAKDLYAAQAEVSK
jgi:hypothetical protein